MGEVITETMATEVSLHQGAEFDMEHQPTHLCRSISLPIRDGLSWSERWEGSDKGLIWCWERGREKRVEDPGLATRAGKGELAILAWKGGVKEKLQIERKLGTLQYLATWQGLRGEDLDLSLQGECVIVCARTGQVVVFSARETDDEEKLVIVDVSQEQSF